MYINFTETVVTNSSEQGSTCTIKDTSSNSQDQMTQNNDAYNTVKGTYCYIHSVLSKCNYYIF